ncbi:MAG: Phage integrase [Modestobacter sp.]|nr:Phage integrase [Modestobacter sp.]
MPDVVEDAVFAGEHQVEQPVGAFDVAERGTAQRQSNRFVPISAPAEHLLQDVRGSQAAERLRAGSAWHETGYVFTTETGEPCDPRNALRAFKVAAARAGIPDAVLHTLRHSAASAMLSHGVPLKVVTEILGHSSIAITGDVYGHVSPDVSRDAVATLGAALSNLGSANGGQNGGQTVRRSSRGRSRSPGNGP